jgi:hypothetical protein
MRGKAKRYCKGCGRERAPADYVCLACGCSQFGDTLPRGVTPPEPEGGDVAGPLAGAWRLPPGRVSLWSGPPGSGKTTLALLTLPEAVVVDLEQDAGQVARVRQREGVRWEETLSPTIVDGVLVDFGLERRRPPALIFDSLTRAPNDLAAAEMLVRWADETGGRAIAIVHETVEGTAWGGHAIPHICWSHLRITRGTTTRQASVLKDRSGAAGRVVPWRMSVDAPPKPRYVSVEGPPGAYRLAEHPHKKAEWADPLTEAEARKLTLPPPPLAVAARRSELYEGGWMEPGDVDDRAKFAEAQGFPFHRPADFEIRSAS